jgi:hypothetical protein
LLVAWLHAHGHSRCLISDNHVKDVDGEVIQNLKRLGRKDPTTKVRLLFTFFSLTFIFLKTFVLVTLVFL